MIERPLWSRQQLRRITGVVVAVALVGSAATAQTSVRAMQVVPPVHILILSSYSADTAYSQLQMSGIRAGLRSGARIGHQISIEFLDIRWQPRERIECQLVDLLHEKYASGNEQDAPTPPRIVVTLDTPALFFADKYLDEFAPNASIVFCAANALPEGLIERRQATGVRERIDVGGAIHLIGQLRPELNRLAILSSPEGFPASMRELAEAALAKDPPTFEVEHVIEADRNALLDRVRLLGPNSAALLLAHHQLLPEAPPNTDESLDEFCREAPIPIFGLFDTMLGHGVVGGSMTSGARQGQKAGLYAAQIAAGASARDLPIEDSESVALLFDGEALERWKIDRALLPPGSEVRNEPLSIWARNRRSITVGAVALALLQAIIIWQLLRSSRRTRESEDRYRDLVELCPDAILVHDGTRFAFANPAALEMFGAPDLETLRRVPVMEIVSPNSRVALRKRFHTVLDEQRPAPPADADLIRLDGRAITVEATGRPCTLEGRRNIQVMLRDVTERRRFDEQVRTLQKMETIGLLAGGVAHDFNNILTAMRISVEEARRSLTHSPTVADRLLGVVGDAVDRAANLVRQLLAIGGRDTPAPAPVALDRAIEESRTLIDRMLGVDIRAEFDLKASDAAVAVDAGRVEQIVVNLAANAADAMDRRGVFSVRTRCVDVRDEEAARFRGIGGRFVEIEVRDSGVGISAEHLPRIFEPFFTTKPSDRGTGLGLATVYGIARRAGGTVSVESRPGDGAVFRVLLPCVDSPVIDPSAAARAVSGASILVVDDEPQIRELAAAFLNSAGYQSHLAADSASALRIAGEVSLTVAVLDVRLGSERGDALAGSLRQMQPELPIVFITGYAAPEELDRLRAIDGSTCVGKPFTPGQLLAAVNESAVRGRAVATGSAGRVAAS